MVAQILGAATFPDQVAVADNWVQQNKSLTGSALAQAVDKQSWDPSVKALTQFPTVLHNLAQNLAWTSQLGEAYHNQQSDVMAAVQALRKQAQTTGNLKTTPQQTVKTETQGGQQTIIIQPANPQVVYVPSYNPTVIYGQPYNPPGYSTADLVATGLLSFGAGMAVGAMISGGCCGWGWNSWNCNWHGGVVVYHGGGYYGNAGWHKIRISHSAWKLDLRSRTWFAEPGVSYAHLGSRGSKRQKIQSLCAALELWCEYRLGWSPRYGLNTP